MAKHLGNVLVVGVSGTTNSGKSTLTNKLVKQLMNCPLFGQDAYFLPPGDPRLECLYIPEVGHCNWEDHRALEMDKMVEDVKQRIRREQEMNTDRCSIILVEGYSIFGWRPLSNLFDLKFFISIDKETCSERRKTRSYNPPDVPGYFEKVVWPMYLKHLEDIKQQEDIVYLDGREDMDTNISKMMCDITKLQNDRQS